MGYTQSLNFVGAFLLLHLPEDGVLLRDGTHLSREEGAFWLLCTFTERLLPDHFTAQSERSGSRHLTHVKPTVSDLTTLGHQAARVTCYSCRFTHPPRVPVATAAVVGVRVDNLVFEELVEAHPTLSAVVRSAPHLAPTQPNPTRYS